MYKKLQEIIKNPVFINYAFLFLLLLYIGIRFIHLPQSIGFGSDEGRDFLTTYNIYTHRQLTLIGPPSEFTINGRQFFFGPAPYYFILPALVLGNWNPLAVSYFLIFLNAGVLVTTLLILNKYIKDKLILYVFAILLAVTPLFVQYTRSYWNPYFMLQVSTLLVGLLVASKYKNQLRYFGLIGFLLGLSMQFHYSFIFAIAVTILWLLLNKTLNFKNSIVVILGFIIGASPLILFDLRNHFYNIQTFLLVLRGGTIHSGFAFNTFYFISLFPFLVFLLSVILAKLNKYLVALALGVYVIICVWSVVTYPSYILNLPELQRIAGIIENDKPTNFNIVDQLTTDNRALALRYLLTVQGNAPLGVIDYSSAKSLYIYSNVPLPNLLKNPVYEIKSFLPFKTEKTWSATHGIYIYRLGK